MGSAITSPYAFLAFALCGVALGCVYAVFAALRRFSGKRKLLVALWDLLFWAIAFVSFVVCLLESTAGVLRLFELAGFGLGFAICLAGPGSYIANSITVFLHFIKRILSKLHKRFQSALEKNGETD